MSKIEFKIATQADLPFIVEIYNQTIAGHMVTATLTPVTVAQRQPWFLAHKPDEHPIWVAFVDGERAGWVSLSPYHPRAAYRITAEISIYIDQKFHHLGLGTKMVKFAENAAPKLGLENIVCLIFGANLPSLGLFKKLGYETWGTLPKVALLAGNLMDLEILGKAVR
ncbi:GNAT family N-acetyltransferase [Pediococcus inopinatus]|jgi:L-amino acid N-acyltransferase YncA|uniref:GNAT family N-acetyltransferase n=1 Tax=Pediococcus inopinatus TaxID=114090 RepID=A0ABZ0Q3U7_9LACO|nr:GNAT family N-acetyltransferase [Pediococcus inopinatus]AVL00759.1 N-acetyltransferase [Pediococcus inopinatus]KRN61738.1 sortase related acyltransferase [Pediococcus inopinatus]WPC16930.1 GNAT family N-acetyltransferase [Pediococcus inopinatus]WPC19953.1 GNAT family N-acetyltransferase [Pediococcus inopinatus]WPC21655.1 GNAT family N-acetyltransferase [Pediococcus inopinatus]